MSDEASKAAANAERAAIKVEMIKKEEEPVVEAKVEETTEEVAEEVAEEETTEEVETAEESDEVKSLKAQLEKERAKFQKRIDRTTAEKKEQASKLAELEKIIAAKTSEDGDRLTLEEAEKRANELAEQKVAEREFLNACNRLANAATKIDKDFDRKITELGKDVAPLPGYMIGILDDLDNGGAILKYFTDNQDEYEEIIAMSQTKMAVKLSKLSTKLETESKVPPKKVSKVPDPITPVGGKGGGNNFVLTDNDTKDMQTFIKKRQAMVEQRRKAGHYNAR